MPYDFSETERAQNFFKKKLFIFEVGTFSIHLFKQIEFYYAPDRFNAVFPVDFFAFGVRSARV
jgi:hypothetical protein